MRRPPHLNLTMLNELPGILLSILILVGVIAVATRIAPRFFSGGAKPADYPYQARNYLFSRAEKSFIRVLEQALGEEFRVFGKVRMEDLMFVKKGAKNRQAARNRIRSRHIDFVVCRKDDLSIQFLVELDDKSHDSNKRAEVDEFKNAACRAAGIKLVRIRAQSSYSSSEVADALEQNT